MNAKTLDPLPLAYNPNQPLINNNMIPYRNLSNTSSLPVTLGPALFVSTLNILAAANHSLTYDFTSDNIENNDTFDFIIVGAGTAGCVVASRLSEVTGWNILLLEAGLPQPIDSIVPYYSENLFETKYDWQYTTKNNGKVSLGFRNGQVPWPRGKMLGGCSSMNGMIYIRGNKQDYRSWNAQNPNWSEKNIYDHFKKAECFQNQKLLKISSVKDTYGHNGPQILNRLNESLFENVFNSLEEIGFNKVVDLNAEEFKNPGVFGHQTVTAANGQRYSTYQSYLQPVRKRQNLKIVTNAFVTKILLDEAMRAYGVEVVIGNRRINIFAKFEVILCSGSINTPQLLMLSGIGPKTHLESKNITCKVNLQAVGKNLQDHISMPIPIYADQPEQMTEADIILNYIKYYYNHTGLLAQSRSANIQAFFSHNVTSKFPEFHAHLILYRKKSIKELTKKLKHYKKSVVKSFTELNENKTLFFFLFHLLHPLSRGTILLNSSNPYDKPLIDANYFGESQDLQLASDGIRMFSRIVNTTYFKSINASLHRINFHECNNFLLNSDLYWKCQTKNMAFTVYHPVGTSKMGPSSNDSVVDNYLKVHSVDGLRVVDAGIMPTEISGNTNAPTIMIGEMGASMIKESYGIF